MYKPSLKQLIAYWSETEKRASDLHEAYRRSRTKGEELDFPSCPFTDIAPSAKKRYRAVARWILTTIKETPDDV